MDRNSCLISKRLQSFCMGLCVIIGNIHIQVEKSDHFSLEADWGAGITAYPARFEQRFPDPRLHCVRDCQGAARLQHNFQVLIFFKLEYIVAQPILTAAVLVPKTGDDARLVRRCWIKQHDAGSLERNHLAGIAENAVNHFVYFERVVKRWCRVAQRFSQDALFALRLLGALAFWNIPQDGLNRNAFHVRERRGWSLQVNHTSVLGFCGKFVAHTAYQPIQHLALKVFHQRAGSRCDKLKETEGRDLGFIPADAEHFIKLLVCDDEFTAELDINGIAGLIDQHAILLFTFLDRILTLLQGGKHLFEICRKFMGFGKWKG